MVDIKKLIFALFVSAFACNEKLIAMDGINKDYAQDKNSKQEINQDHVQDKNSNSQWGLIEGWDLGLEENQKPIINNYINELNKIYPEVKEGRDDLSMTDELNIQGEDLNPLEKIMSEQDFGAKILTMKIYNIGAVVKAFVRSKKIQNLMSKDLRFNLSDQLAINLMKLNLYMKFWTDSLQTPSENSFTEKDNVEFIKTSEENKNKIIKSFQFKEEKNSVSSDSKTLDQFWEKLQKGPDDFSQYLQEKFSEKEFIKFYYSTRYTYILAQYLITHRENYAIDEQQSLIERNIITNIKVINGLVAQIHTN